MAKWYVELRGHQSPRCSVHDDINGVVEAAKIRKPGEILTFLAPFDLTPDERATLSAIGAYKTGP